MSNCMSFRPGAEIWLEEPFVDVMRLHADLKALPATKPADAPDGGMSDATMLWWFVENAVTLWPDKHRPALAWHVGTGRSSHTFRDFAGTLWTLQKYVKQPFAKVLNACDVENNIWANFRAYLITRAQYERLTESGRNAFHYGMATKELFVLEQKVGA
jgi:hypothetical protein